jgi:hypothetical protein
VKTVALATLSYAIFSAIPGIALSGAILYSQTPRRPNAFDDFLVVLYLAAVSSAVSAIGFLISTGFAASWRCLAAMRAAIISAALGLASPIATLVVAAVSAVALLPLFRSGSRLSWVAAGLFYGLPGIVLGLAALLIAKAWSPKRS